MKHRILLFCAVTLMLISPDLTNSRDNKSVEHTLAPPCGVPSIQTVDDAAGSNVVTRLLQTPLHFVANEGQMDARVFYYARSDGATIYCTDQGLVFGFEGGSVSLKFSEKRCVKPEARAELPGRINYFIGSDPASWRTGVPAYGEVVYPSVYSGIHLAYSGDQRRLKYTFYVQPGADPDQIQMKYEGVEDIRVDEKTGELVIQTEWGEIRDMAPVAYQKIGSGKRNVDIRFHVIDRSIAGFVVEDYDDSYALVLDPMYSTYLGGIDWDSGYGIGVDSSGSAYVTGLTVSAFGFPIRNAYQSTHGGSSDIFVTKLSSAGSLEYSTYLGGSDFDVGYGIGVDSSGVVYVTGLTASTNGFPIRNAYQDTHGGGGTDAFVIKLSTAGSLEYSTYLGGSAGDVGYGIAVDSSGRACVTGETESTTGFPLQNAFRGTHGGGTDAFVTKLSATGSLEYSTYLGGSGYDVGYGIAAGSSGGAYVTGLTSSAASFPIQNAFQSAYGGHYDAFVTMLSDTGSLEYSTFLGGSDEDTGYGIAVDSSGGAYVTGSTLSAAGFPLQNAYQDTHGGILDAFVTMLSDTGSLEYSTYLGGSDEDAGYGIAVDRSGRAYVTGETKSSTDFPIQNAGQSAHGGGRDAFVAMLSDTGSLEYSTYLGGSDNDVGRGIAAGNSGRFYVTGYTSSAINFPVQNAYQSAYGGGLRDAFVRMAALPSNLLPWNPELPSGWSLFSFPVNKCFYSGSPPADHPECVELVDISTLGFSSMNEWFSSLLTPVNPVDPVWVMVIGVDGILIRALPQFSTLTYMSPICAYWVQIEEASGGAILTIDGARFDLSCPIPLDDWELVGYPSTTGYYDAEPHPDIPGVTWVEVEPPVAEYVLRSIDGQYDMVIGSNGSYFTWLPDINTLHSIDPGGGYWVHMTSPGSLVYSEAGSEAAMAAPPRRHPGQLITRKRTVPPSITFMLVYGEVMHNAEALDPGAQVQVFTKTGTLCGDFTAAHAGLYGTMLVYGDEPLTPEIEGARPGDELLFYVNGAPAETDGIIYWRDSRIPQRVSLVCRDSPLPKVSMLDQNYPNPFNPDTWIPYQLKEDARVEIRIYTSTGQLVRTLNLGHKPAGFYTDKPRTAYWDGRNEAGEEVSSGTYFYTIQAGNFRTTRKMVVAN